MSTIVHVLIGASVVLLFGAALIGVQRIAHGPSQLDRSAAADLMVAVVICGIGLWIAATHQRTTINILLLLSMLGFTSAVAIARMVADRVVSRRRHGSIGEPGRTGGGDR